MLPGIPPPVEGGHATKGPSQRAAPAAAASGPAVGPPTAPSGVAPLGPDRALDGAGPLPGSTSPPPLPAPFATPLYAAAPGAGPPAVPSPAVAGAALFGGLVERFTEIVGEGPSYATFHFASMQEGARLAAGADARDLPQILARVDSILGQHSGIVQAPDGMGSSDVVVLAVDDSPMLESRGKVGAGIVIGFLEGVLKAVHKRPYEGVMESLEGHHAMLRFRGRAAA